MQVRRQELGRKMGEDDQRRQAPAAEGTEGKSRGRKEERAKGARERGREAAETQTGASLMSSAEQIVE